MFNLEMVSNIQEGVIYMQKLLFYVHVLNHLLILVSSRDSGDNPQRHNLRLYPRFLQYTMLLHEVLISLPRLLDWLRKSFIFVSCYPSLVDPSRLGSGGPTL